MINFGIIGVGRIGKVHMESIQQNSGAKLVAVADPFIDEATISLAKERYGLKKIYTDYKKILDDSEVDAVLICSSTNTHAKISIEAARCGKHILCEKPISSDIDEIKKVMETVAETGIKYQVGFNRRFDHNFMEVKSQAKSLGNIHIIKITSRDPEPPPIEYVKVSGGLFNDMMIHDFDMVRYLSDAEVIEVHAYGNALINPEIGSVGDVDTAIVSMLLSNGAIAVIDNSRKAVYGYDQRVEVFCSGGMANAENDTGTTVKVSTENSVSTEKPLHFFLERYMQAYEYELDCFIKSIETDTKTLCNANDGLKPVLIAKACKKSLEQKRAVRLSEIEKEYSL